MAGAFRKAHKGSHNHQAMIEGHKMEDDLIRERNENLRSAPHRQADVNASNLVGSVSGYKSETAANQARIARPVSDQTWANATKTLTKAKQGLQEFGNFTTPDPYTDEFILRNQIMDESGIIPGIGKVLSGSDDPVWAYAARKQAQQFHDAYKQFVFSQVDLSRPESREYWEKKFPEYTKSLRDGLRKNRMLRARLEDIGLYGVQNEEDMWLLYMSEGNNVAQENYLQFVQGINPNRSYYQSSIAGVRNFSGDSPFDVVGGGSLVRNVFEQLRNFVFPNVALPLAAAGLGVTPVNNIA